MIFFKGNCHCKAVKFKFLCNSIVELLECNCSICYSINYLHLIVPHKNFKLVSGKKLLSKYTFGTKKAEHYFCSLCGIKSFYQPRSHSNSYSINFRCIGNPPKVKKIIKFNGKAFEESIKNLNL